jgi:hypothetical protein
MARIKTTLIYGTIAGLITALAWLVGELVQPSGEEKNMVIGMIIGYAAMLLGFTMIFIGIKSYRDKVLGGIITYGNALLLGLSITMVSSIIYVAGWMFYMPRYAPDYMDIYVATEIINVENSSISPDEKQQKITELETFLADYKKPHIIILYTLMEIVPVGALLSLIAAGVFRKKS